MKPPIISKFSTISLSNVSHAECLTASYNDWNGFTFIPFEDAPVDASISPHTIELGLGTSPHIRIIPMKLSIVKKNGNIDLPYVSHPECLTPSYDYGNLLAFIPGEDTIVDTSIGPHTIELGCGTNPHVRIIPIKLSIIAHFTCVALITPIHPEPLAAENSDWHIHSLVPCKVPTADEGLAPSTIELSITQFHRLPIAII
mmetsp:Transcript_41198/g.81300  ORF Transcript_41198/g.81300 Transcript_41198/m.81300 type:complete len:200 (-) Transcript_41198:458-1057(-)